jgi:hypothetical protein
MVIIRGRLKSWERLQCDSSITLVLTVFRGEKPDVPWLCMITDFVISVRMIRTALDD